MEDVVTFALIASYLAFIALDYFAPARDFPRMATWRLKGLAFFVFNVSLATFAPLLWNDWLGEHRLIDATSLGTWAGALAGFTVLELFVYGWHRTLHNVPFLWRSLHQLHHSAERVDVFGAFYFHPLDMLAFTFATSLGLVWVVGLTPQAAILANGVATFCAFFQHSNVRTPAWLGYFVQRPESHALHHQRSIHGHNYSDFPLWDIVFGTFKNPATWNEQAGFYEGASERVGAMLIGRDVATPPDEAPERTSFASPAL